MHCCNCGEILIQAARFCSTCGARVPDQPSIGTPEVTSPQEHPHQRLSFHKLAEGTEVLLEFTETVSSSSALTGDKIQLMLADDLRVGDQVLARRGAPAVGTVTNCQKRRMLARGAELNLRADYFKIKSTKVPLRANQGGQGYNRAGTAVALGILVGPFALMKRGNDVVFPAGARMRAYVDDDTDIPLEIAPS